MVGYRDRVQNTLLKKKMVFGKINFIKLSTLLK